MTNFERIHIFVLLCTCFTLVQAINGKIITIIYKVIDTSYGTAISLWPIHYSQEIKVLKYPKNFYLYNVLKIIKIYAFYEQATLDSQVDM